MHQSAAGHNPAVGQFDFRDLGVVSVAEPPDAPAGRSGPPRRAAAFRRAFPSACRALPPSQKSSVQKNVPREQPDSCRLTTFGCFTRRVFRISPRNRAFAALVGRNFGQHHFQCHLLPTSVMPAGLHHTKPPRPNSRMMLYPSILSKSLSPDLAASSMAFENRQRIGLARATDIVAVPMLADFARHVLAAFRAIGEWFSHWARGRFPF